MKRLHRDDIYGWSVFDERLDIDFHSVVWVRPDGNVVIDPLPLSEHDRAHLEQLGPVSTIVIEEIPASNVAVVESTEFVSFTSAGTSTVNRLSSLLDNSTVSSAE